ncbi:hypothetical protein [Amycolatopsis dongchuanensis]|uniref:Uncharacterized protein n=1 Tax=Amycolatopsis dongchuanensis TaxID=1070866 RepID=A0ABP8VG84_9PSEU
MVPPSVWLREGWSRSVYSGSGLNNRSPSFPPSSGIGGAEIGLRHWVVLPSATDGLVMVDLVRDAGQPEGVGTLVAQALEGVIDAFDLTESADQAYTELLHCGLPSP